MNQHNQPYPPFPPQQQPFGYQTAPYQAPATGAYPYAANQVPQQLQQQQQQPQYFQSLPQGNTGNSRSTPQQRQQNNGIFGDAPSPVPETPGNGPGAPPPQPDSPPINYEENLMNVLRQENENQSNPNGNANGNANDNDDDEDDDDGDVDPDEPVFQLPPPPEAEYRNEVELEDAIHAWSKEHGYELVRRASKKNAKGQLYKRYFHCSKHGKVSSSKTPQKDRVRINRKSNRIGCPMSLAAVSVNPHDPSGNWQIRHRKTHHNHPAVDAMQLAGHRRRARAGGVEKAVDGLFAIGTKTTDVLKFLQRTNPEGLFQRTDVANMKQKWLKYGTCAHHGDSTEKQPPQIPITPGKTGFPSACQSCRSKKSRCDSVRPVCGTCARTKTACHYDHDPHPRVPQPVQNPPRQNSNNHQQTSAGADSMQIDSEQPTMIDLSNTQLNQSQNAASASQAQQVFAALAAFQQEHVKPQRLTLEHSSVQSLASSTCGSGESYKASIPRQFVIGNDWRMYRDAFESAAIKENCADVLRGDLKEPTKISSPPDGSEIPVEEHNEYVKQLAIFRRRNDMLKLGFRETLSPGLWNRVRLLHTAHEIWTALEDMCMPRGSDQAYVRFNEISGITLASCNNNLDNYIFTLQLKVDEYNALAHSHESRRPAAALNQSNAEAYKRKMGGNGTFPDDVLCFLFLRGLGPQHQNLAGNLTKKNNIGGFGSGDRIGFKELTTAVKRMMERVSSRG
ncbi:hypothetical protein HII31_02672 [Pseudocercospora fuligena]|uniref:Zn(2)-C6 fungal-type domain-containing protein n=1 Tax=Pseudocercospora fuligena TaxID=685502 RepID=A0A8H6RRX9_9PEZI|nr:hypothetical protein HII31_02672 [Pseudocercospora fuligena]